MGWGAEELLMLMSRAQAVAGEEGHVVPQWMVGQHQGRNLSVRDGGFDLEKD